MAHSTDARTVRHMAHSLITTESVAALRARIGQPVRRVTPPFYTEVNADAASRFAWAIGDDNPLYHDPAHAAGTRWGGQLAPPTILYSLENTVSGAVEGLPGVHAMFAGTDFRWERPVAVGTRFRTESVLHDIVEHRTRFAGTAIQQIYRIRFLDAEGRLVAEADSWCFRTERDTARERGSKYEDEPGEPHRYTDEEVAAFQAHYMTERPRGGATLHFEDVAVGDSVGPILKGPYTVTAAVAFMQAWGSYAVRNHRQAWQYYHRHPGLSNRNGNNVPEPPVRVHWDQQFAREVGVPGAYDFGPERVAWLGHLMTDWMGDDGFLKRLNIQIRGHNMVGDATWCRGEVVCTRREGGQGVVECAVRAVNQHDRTTAVGTATVVLPCRGA